MLLAVYMFLQLALCYYISKRLSSESDYFVAGRNFPLIIVSVSLFATWFGAETCIGSAGAVYDEGLSGSRADPFGYGLCLLLSGLLIARKIWNQKYITLADFYRDRYGALVEQFAVWILAFSSLIWCAAQLRAFGQVISATTEWPLQTTLFVGFIFVLGYTLLGGLLGDMISDTIQAVVIAIGLTTILVIVIMKTPDIGSILSQIPAERLTLRGVNESWWARIDRWAVPILGSLVAQEIVARIFAARNKTIAVRACYWGCGVYIFFGMIPVFIGLIGPNIMSLEAHSEQFLIHLAKAYLPPVAMAAFTGALISALLSTIDSILLSVGALASHNFLVPRLKITNEKTKLLTSRLVVFGAGIVAYILAVFSEGIYELLSMASSFGTAGILVITLVGLWFPFGQKWAAFSALVVGLITTPIATYVFKAESPFLISIIAALAVYIALGISERKQGSAITTAENEPLLN